jgi:HD-like signal output (HDOD) protein
MTDKFLKNRLLKKVILEAVNNLPPMPQVMHKAQAMINDPASSLKDLEELINTDQEFKLKDSLGKKALQWI